MIFMNLLIGAGAGYLTPILEPRLKALAESITLTPIKPRDTEFDMLALLVMLMGAHVVLAILGVHSSVFAMCLGAGLGLFGKRIWAHFQSGQNDT